MAPKNGTMISFGYHGPIGFFAGVLPDYFGQALFLRGFFLTSQWSDNRAWSWPPPVLHPWQG